MYQMYAWILDISIELLYNVHLCDIIIFLGKVGIYGGRRVARRLDQDPEAPAAAENKGVRGERQINLGDNGDQV